MRSLYVKVTEWLKGVIYIIPSLVLFSIFVIYPFARTILQSLYLSDNRGFFTLFVGVDNYARLFADSSYASFFIRTVLYTLITVPLTIGISLLLAVLSNKELKGIGIFKTIFSSSMGVSAAAGSAFWSFFFHPTAGLLNHMIKYWGGKSVGWLTDPRYALISISAVTIWGNIGFSYLILMGGLKNIDASYYESADIAGSRPWYRLRRITIPLLSPSLFSF